MLQRWVSDKTVQNVTLELFETFLASFGEGLNSYPHLQWIPPFSVPYGKWHFYRTNEKGLYSRKVIFLSDGRLVWPHDKLAHYGLSHHALDENTVSVRNISHPEIVSFDGVAVWDSTPQLIRIYGLHMSVSNSGGIALQPAILASGNPEEDQIESELNMLIGRMDLKIGKGCFDLPIQPLISELCQKNDWYSQCPL